MTGTVSTVDIVKRQLITIGAAAMATAALDGGPVEWFYAWPGRDSPPECAFLGLFDQHQVDVAVEHVAANTGRQQLEETYTVPITVWAFRPDLDPSQALECEQRTFAMFDPFRDALVDDSRLGLGSQILWARPSWVANLIRRDSGWASELIVNVQVRARLL
jgi:hypothetical protein